MNERLTPPDWDSFDKNMLINVGDMKYYYENFTGVVDEQATGNKLAIETIDGRVTALEQSIPVGPGGDGAYLHLGGTPDRYPTAEEMVAGSDKSETSFMVIARPDGIYFYNPKTKVVIPPKKGGGTIAVHGQFPQIFDAGHAHNHEGRAGLSGIYTAKVTDVGLDGHFTNFDTVTMLVVVNEDGEEYQTAYSPDGMASRIFRAGIQTAHWGVNAGGGGGGSVDPIIIQEIKDRLDALEAHDHIDKITELSDVVLDPVTDVNGLLYMGEDGKVRGGETNPMLGMGYTHVHTNSIGAPPVVTSSSVNSTVMASNNIIVFRGTLSRQIQLPGVVPYNTYRPSTTQVREGRTTFIVNSSNTTLTVKAPSGGMFYVEGGMDSTNAVVPAQTVYVYNPAILDNGSGAMIQCWIYMGNYQLRASDLSGVLTEIQGLKDKDASQDLEILKTQADLAATDVAVEATNERIDSHLVDFNKISTGGKLISWNTLGADPVSTSGDVTAANMGSCPFVVGMGAVTGKKFIMAEIVDRTVTSLTSTQVREGRTTYLVNMSSVTRSVELTGGCKFNITGSLVTTKQTIPAKAVWVFTPGIYSNGDKVWTFNGTFSTEVIDFKELVNRVSALEAGGGPGSGGVTEFTGLTDTPTSYTGQKNKFLAVKDDESGVEFVVTPSIDVRPIEDRLDVLDQNIAGHVADFELMRDGHIPTSWNGLGARPITSPNDITVANITESPFVIGTGTVAGKKFILPDIAELGVMSLGANQVREGRATYLVNLGNVDRIVELSAGCKINMTGGSVFESQIIPRKTAWMMSPGVFAGDKVWTFLGALSTEALDIEGLVLRLSAVETAVAKKPVSSDVEYKSLISTGNVQNATIGDQDVVIQELLSSSNPIIWLPMIVDRTTTPTNNQCWAGKRYVFLNRGDIDTVVKVPGTATLVLPDRSTTTNLTLKKGHSVEFVTSGDATAGVWILVRMGPIDDSAPPPATFKDLTDTPNSYTPNQVLRYNASGTAVISSAFDFKNLGDTPGDYSGHKNKMVVVNNGETALEFKPIPDTSGLQTGIDNNHNDIIALQNMDTVIGNNVSALDARVETLENAPAPVGDFKGLTDTPNTLEANKYLVVNAAGTAIEHSGMTTDDTAGLVALAQGSGSGDVLLHQNCLGGPTVLSGEQIIQGSLVASSAMVLVSAWQDGGFVNMPKITSHLTSPLPANHVRAGRVTSIYNRSSNSKSITIRPDPSWTATIKMKNKSYTNINNFVLGPGRVAKFTPLIDAGVQYWALIEEYAF